MNDQQQESSPKTLQAYIINLALEASASDVPIPTVSPNWKLEDDLGLSSLDIVYLSIEVERAFGIKFENNDLSGVSTIDDIITMVELKIAQITKTNAAFS